MTKVIIIGAGPAGLYAAIKFKKAGLNDIAVYDPRAGIYTRPGHVTSRTITKVSEGIGVDFWPDKEKNYHIKDIERALYAEAIKLEIMIDRKKFIRLHQAPINQGVVVADENGEEILVFSDYIFDCTGSHRQVIEDVNRIKPDAPPFKLEPIAIKSPKNHLLAYVKVSTSQWERFNCIKEEIGTDISKIDPVFRVQSIIKLSSLGWHEWVIPNVYGASFGKDKVCIYLHTPPSLVKEDYDHWLTAVLQCYLPSIQYEHLSPSKKYKYKPRFMTFTSNPQELIQMSYKGEDLPTVIALGDAQIDSYFELGNGIYNGMRRIDALFNHMKISNGDISYYDSLQYMQLIHKELTEHKDAIGLVAALQGFSSAFGRFLERLQLALVAEQADNVLDKDAINAIIKKRFPQEVLYQGPPQEVESTNAAESSSAAVASSSDVPLDQQRFFSVKKVKVDNQADAHMKAVSHDNGSILNP
ncbi:MAG: FAD-dependent oxidoreductase [Legionellales bacterium]